MIDSINETTKDNIFTKKMSGINLNVSIDYRKYKKATLFFTKLPNRDLYFGMIEKQTFRLITQIDNILNSHLDDAEPSIARYYSLLREKQNILKQIHQGCIDKNWNWTNLL